MGFKSDKLTSGELWVDSLAYFNSNIRLAPPAYDSDLKLDIQGSQNHGTWNDQRIDAVSFSYSKISDNKGLILVQNASTGSFGIQIGEKFVGKFVNPGFSYFPSLWADSWGRFNNHLVVGDFDPSSDEYTGSIQHNSSSGYFEGYNGSEWRRMSGKRQYGILELQHDELGTPVTIDWDDERVRYLTISLDASIEFSNLEAGGEIKMWVSGDVSIDFPAYTDIMQGAYDGTRNNFIHLHCIDDTSGGEKVVILIYN